MDIAATATAVEREETNHLARLLILVCAFTRDTGPAIEGITKLAKLDFLLRYPSCFERALKRRNASKQATEIAPFERRTVESGMIRYRYGPWDFRYRRFINLLAARGLISMSVDGRTIIIDPTDKGLAAASRLQNSSDYQTIAGRAASLKQHLDIGATAITRFIYDTFPELSELSLTEEIHL